MTYKGAVRVSRRRGAAEGVRRRRRRRAAAEPVCSMRWEIVFVAAGLLATGWRSCRPRRRRHARGKFPVLAVLAPPTRGEIGTSFLRHRRPKREVAGASPLHPNPTWIMGFSGGLTDQDRPAERPASGLTCFFMARENTQ